MTLKVKSLGLAAYIKMKGGVIKGYTRSEGFEITNVDKDEEAFRTEYMNSECSKHDYEVMTLRDYIKDKK